MMVISRKPFSHEALKRERTERGALLYPLQDTEEAYYALITGKENNPRGERGSRGVWQRGENL